MIENKEIQETKTINIYPCKNTRRILVFLADFFICFIAAIFLFEIVARPIAYSSMGYKKKAQEVEKISNNNLNILYDNELLYFSEISYGNYRESIKYSCRVFTSDFCLNNIDRPHDVFKKYYTDFLNEDLSNLIELYSKKASKYFDIDVSNNSINLKHEYVDLFSPLFNESDEISEKGSKEYEKFEQDFYLNFYSSIILKGVKKNDLISNLHPEYGSYIENENLIRDFDNTIKLTVNITAVVTFVIIMLIFYFIVPLTNKKGSTVGEMILKVERVDISTLKYMKKGFVISEGIINTLTNTIMIFLIPFITYGIDLVFTLTELVTLAIVGLAFLIIEFILLLSTKMNQTLKEFSTHTICVDTSTMDLYYREKGYDF